MGAEKEIIVALEFGTSAIRGIAGRQRPDGTVQILNIEQERTVDAIQRGVIYNIDKTTQAISNIVGRFNERLNVRVRQAYVGVSGQSLHTAGNFISRGLETKVKITPELIDNLMDNNRATQYTDSKILDVVPQEYVVGNRTVTDPIGIQTDQLEARFLNVVARNILMENIQKCMHMAGLEIADLVISPLALAEVLLSDSEKRSGCAMVDFGAGTTTVAVYNGNLLRHLVVIPLGGNNITADIATAHQMEFDEAEMLKRKHGVAYVASDSDTPQMLPISNERTLSENDLQNIIGARQEEIIANVWNQIEPMRGNLLSGILVTGGAAQLKDMPEAIKHYTQFEKVKMSKSLITTADVAPGVLTPQGNSTDTLIALLMRGGTNCVAEPKEEEEKLVADEDIAQTPETKPADTAVDAKAAQGGDDLQETGQDEKQEKEEKEPPVAKPKKPGFMDRMRRWGKNWSEMFTEE